LGEATFTGASSSDADAPIAAIRATFGNVLALWTWFGAAVPSAGAATSGIPSAGGAPFPG